MVQKDSSISGIPGRNVKIKMSCFADDSSVFLSDDYSINRFFRITEQYQRASGAKINYKKPSVCSWGSGQLVLTTLLEFLGETPFQLQGYSFGRNVSEEEVWLPLLRKWTRILHGWKSPAPSFKSKSVVLNSVILPVFFIYNRYSYIPLLLVSNFVFNHECVYLFGFYYYLLL